MALPWLAKAQCPSGDITLNNQAQVNAFPPGCTVLAGSLTIQGTDITDLSPLSAIIQIGTTLQIANNNQLTTLTGLSSLTSVGRGGGSLLINDNPILTNIASLSAVTYIGRMLQIANNAKLTTLTGVEKLTTLTDLSIQNNTSLTSIAGLSAVTRIIRTLQIANNTVLPNLTGLEKLTSVGVSVEINDNASLTSLGGLSALTQLEFSGVLQISGNTKLPDLTGLNKLTRAFDVSIQNNASLTSLAGLNAVTRIDGGLQVSENPQLTSLTGLEKLTAVGNAIVVKDNPTLTSIASLSAVTQTSGLEISNNGKLTTLTGLEKLTAVGNDIVIKGNPVLTSISGLSALTQLRGLEISNNATLPNLMGLEKLTSLDGYLLINNNPTLTSVASLSAVTQLSGLELKSNAKLLNLTGLEKVSSATDIYIQDNAVLTSITGLNGLTQIDREFYITGNAGLPSLAGLEKLTRVDNNLFIQNNGVLTSLAGLSALTQVGGLFQITDNAGLPNLTGLEKLTSIGNLTINNNPALLSIASLSALTRIGGTLQITNNARLPTLTGLEKLTSLNFGLSINNNPVLTSIGSLSALTRIGMFLQITNNTQLSQCAITPICQLLATAPNNAIISGNATGCSSVAEVQVDCLPLSITAQPPTQASICVGNAVTPSVSTSGTARAYQWYKGDQSLAGQTTKMLSLTNVQTADAGTYRVVVSNSVSSLTSTAFSLTVNTQSPDYQPLVDLYSGTGGANWTKNTNWLTGCTPCTWYGVTCDGRGRVTGLDLTNNGLIGPIPASLGQLTSLQTLRLLSNQLSGPIPVSLSNLTNLNFLGIGRNHLTGTIPPELSNLTQLTVLALDNNELKGAIPASLSALTNLQAIFLSENQLSGSIPAYIGSLSNLDLLWLDHNQLSGIVPASLGNLAKLTSLFLNNNQLSGCFPASLSALCGRPNSRFDFSNNTNLPGGGNFGAFCTSGVGSDAFRPLATAIDNPICAGTPVSLSVSTGTFYQWSGPAGFTASVQSPVFTPATAASSGLYLVTVGNGSPACTATASISLTVNALPTPSISPSASTICAGQTVILSATPDLSSYRWSTGQNTASISVTATCTYSVTATNTSGCSATATASVTVKPTPLAPTLKTQSGQNGQLYPGGQSFVTIPQYSGIVTLLISGCTGTVNWQGPNGTSGSSTSIPVSTTSTGTFVYQATCQQGGCPSALGSATVVVQSGALMMVAPLYDCQSRQLTLRTTGGNGQPIEYQIASVTTGWESVSSTFTVQDKHIGKTLKLRARQRSSTGGGYIEVEMGFTPTNCGSGRQAVSQEWVTPLSVVVLGNPLTGQELSVEIRGAEGQPLQLALTDSQGRAVGEQHLPQAGAVERRRFEVGSQPAGLLLLQVSTPTQRQSVKVLKVD